MKQLKHNRIKTRKLHKKLLKNRQTRLKKTLNTKKYLEREDKIIAEMKKRIKQQNAK